MNNYSLSKGGRDLYCLIFLGFVMSFLPLSAKNQSRHSNSFSQQHKVQGAVTDGTNPLPGVTIALKNKKNNAAISDYSGQFSLSCSPYDTLVVSYIGFKTALVPIMGRSVVDIKLSYDTTTLQEVLVNAGYYSVKESERTGSIARITSKDIESQPVTNVLAAMQGRMAGVSITQTTGVPGGGFDIKIRGQNSLRSDANAPLYIIDGVPYSSDPIGYNQTSTTLPNITSPLNSISPDSIESIEILKDADATSIYGSRGANGVVLITTKKGKTGKTSVTLNASTGAGTVARFMKLMNTQQYLDMRRQAFINDGIPYRASDYDINGTWDQNRYTDWQKELIGGTALINSFQGSISGGSDKTQFLISANYHTESSVFKGDFPYKKGGGQFNLNHTSENNKFRLNFTFGYTAQDNQQPAFDFTYDARSLAPNAPELYSSDGSLNWENGTWDNPLRNLNAEYKSKTNDFISNLMLSYDILPGLTVKTSAGYTNLNTVETRTSPSTIYNPAYNINSSFSSIYFNSTKRSSWIAEPQISFTKEWEIGKFNMLLGGTFQNQKTDRLYQSGDGFSSNSLIYSLSAASFQTVLLDDQTIYKYQAFFGRLNYNYKQRYIINFTARRDGSSRFSPENQFSNFGAVGAAWLFSNENFMKESGWLSFGKLRFSYGTTGSDQIGDYQFLNTYNLTAANYDGNVGIAPSRLYNKDFGWETNKKLEAAIENGFLNDRLFLTAAWYRNREIEVLYINEKIKTLFCTSTLLEGVNLPANNLFTLQPKKNISPLSRFEFGNLIGRAGRLNSSLYGSVYYLERPDDLIKASEYLEVEYEKEIEIFSANAFLDFENDDLKVPIKDINKSDKIKTNKVRQFCVFLRLKYLKDDGLVEQYLKNKDYSQDKIDEVKGILSESLSTIKIPYEVLKKNPTIDPMLQNDLYELIINSNIEEWVINKNSNYNEYFNADEVSSISNKNKPFYWQLVNLVERLDSVFDLRSEALIKHNKWITPRSACVQAKKWLANLPIGQIIQENIKYQCSEKVNEIYRKNPDSLDDVNSIINETIKYNSSITTYLIPKYIKILTDVLDIILTDEQKEEYKLTLSLSTCLELGTQEPTVIQLISAGVTRSVAIQLNRVYKKNTTKEYRENNTIWQWLSNKNEIPELKPIYNRYLKRLKVITS